MLSTLITGGCGYLTVSNTAVLVRMRETEFSWVHFFVLIV